MCVHRARRCACCARDLRSWSSLFVFVETPFREFRSTRRFGCLFSSSPPSPRRCVGASRSSSIYFKARATRVVSLCDIDCLASSRIVRLASWLSPSKCARVSTRVGGSGFDVSLRSRDSARVLGPRGAVLARPPEHLDVAVLRRVIARPLVPRAYTLHLARLRERYALVPPQRPQLALELGDARRVRLAQRVPTHGAAEFFGKRVVRVFREPERKRRRRRRRY